MTYPQIKIFDTTLRDGEQSPGCSMNLAEKIRMARQLDRLGVDIIEAGFPIASEGDFEAVASYLERDSQAHNCGACARDARRHRTRVASHSTRRPPATSHLPRHFRHSPGI